MFCFDCVLHFDLGGILKAALACNCVIHTHKKEKEKIYDESVCHTISHVELICLRQNVD